MRETERKLRDIEIERESDWTGETDWERVLSTDWSQRPAMAPHKPSALYDAATGHHHAT